MLTTDCACRIPPGTTKSASPTSFTRSSTVTPSFWKRSRTRSSWAFASSSSPLPFATALRATSTRSWRHSPHHLWLSNFRVLFHDSFLVAKCAYPTHERTQGFAALHRFVQSCRFSRVRFSCCCQTDPSIFARFLIVVKARIALTLALTSHCSHYAERFTYSTHTLFHLILEYCVLSWLTLKLGFIYFLAHIRRFVMASSSPTTSIPIQEPVFLQFLHDVHHAYLLLHRAMALLPPTLIPNIEPTPLPSTDVWNQPDGLRPHYSDQTNDFIDNAHIPSPDIVEDEALMDELLETHLPEPHHHVAAPSPEVLPAPSKLSTRTPSPPTRKQKAKSAPKAPAKRHRRLDQSRFRSSSPLSLWTSEDKQKLRTLKADEKSRFSWRVISTKMGKSEEDVRSMWNKIKDKLG